MHSITFDPLRRSFQTIAPAGALSAFVFASPHSGRHYEDAFLKEILLNAQDVRRSEDAFVDELIKSAPDLGAPLLAAISPRAYVDLNRGADELDSSLIQDTPSIAHNPRIASGLGVIPRVVGQGMVLYNGQLAMDAAQERLTQIWRPYHAELQNRLHMAQRAQGAAVLVDFHSMPSAAVQGYTAKLGFTPDIVLGDRFGAAASKQITDQIERFFTQEGFQVSRNTPFAGAYVLQKNGRPQLGQHAIQIEMNRALYLDEPRIEKHAGFKPLQEKINRIIAQIIAMPVPF